MTIIQAYTFIRQAIEQDNHESAAKWKKRCANGGFNPHTNIFTPFRDISNCGEYVVLDSIAAAVESGIIDTDNWVAQIFDSVEVFETFLAQLEEFDYYRINDRWYTALFSIAQVGDEEGFVTCQEIADSLRTAAEDTGQI
ncbi:hypothetical protein [Undibacterium macrobrachii]|uniref:Uncharacterized protein n=1 Tax=Undibacterium macrobrachii TaxID=1119058 RepID=A0ABQ2XNI8_9BURK|nr:hypothetical protein [Undibacterium macrobrachii]GGX23246.1 hypothetical protein GCM10011282_31680 [Undibacterium macrobrachii]